MKKIKIISGTYGYNDGRHIIPKNRNSEAFAVEDKEADRLIALGVAESVEEPCDFKETSEDTYDTSEENPTVDDLSYDANSSVPDLRRIGREIGLTFAVGTTKADMIAALDDYFGESAEESADDFEIEVEGPVE